MNPNIIFTVLDGLDTIPINPTFNARLDGNTGGTTINLESDGTNQATATSIEENTTVQFTGNSSDFTYNLDGTTLQVTDATDTVIAEIAVGADDSTLKFADGSTTFGLNADQDGITLGGQALTADAPIDGSATDVITDPEDVSGIVPDDGPMPPPTGDDFTLTESSNTVDEGGTVTYTVTANGAVSADTTLTFNVQGNDLNGAASKADPSDDFSPASGTVSFAAGAEDGATQTFTVTAADDGEVEGLEGIQVSLLDEDFNVLASETTAIQDAGGVTRQLTNSSNSGSFDTFTGTSSDDSFLGSAFGSLEDGDTVTDPSTTDSDLLTGRFDLSGTGATAVSITPTIENVEEIRLTGSNGENAGDDITFDGSSTTGVQSIVANAFTAGAAGQAQLIVNNVTTDTAIGVRGGDGNGNVSVTFDSVTGTEDSADVAFSNSGQANNLTVNNVETLNVSASGEGNSLADLNANNVQTLNISGDGAFSLTDTSANLPAATTIDASTNTGGVTLGDSTTTLNNATTTATGGSGDDTVHLTAGNVAATDSFDGGKGTDTVRFNGGTNTNASVVANFEALSVTDATTYDLSAFTNSDIAAVSVAGGGAGTVSSLAGETVTFLNDTLTYTLNAAAADTTINVALNNGVADAADGIDVGGTAFNTNANVTGVNITSVDPDNALNLSNDDTNSIADVDVKTVTVDATANTAVTTGASTESVNATGSTGDLTLNAAASAQAVSVTGGEGADTITGSGNNDTLAGGAGNDVVTVGAGDDTVTLGAGDDAVVASLTELTSADSIDGGDGTDVLRTNQLSNSNNFDLTAANAGKLSGLSNMEQIQMDVSGLTSGQNATLTAGDATSSALGGATISFNDNTGAAATATVDVSAAVLNSSTFVVDGSTLNDDKLTFNGGGGTETVTGSGNADTFTFGTTAFLSSSDSLDGGAGGDTLTFTEDTSGGSGETTSVTAAQLGGVSNVETLNVTLAGTDTGDTFSITLDDAVASANADTNGAFTVAQTNGNGALTVDGSAVTGTDLTLTGNGNADTLTGGAGADTLTGSGGNDTLTGGAGDDDFALGSTTASRDTITDFDFGDASGSNTTDDQLDVSGSNLTFNAAFDTVVQDSTAFAADEDVVVVTSQTFNNIGEVDTFYEGRVSVNDSGDVLVLWQDGFGNTHVAQGVDDNTTDTMHTFNDLAVLDGVGISGITNTVDTGDFIV